MSKLAVKTSCTTSSRFCSPHVRWNWREIRSPSGRAGRSKQLGINRIAFIPSFSNYFVVWTSQNKSLTQLDVLLLILCFYRLLGLICNCIWWFSFAKSTNNRSFALIARELTKVGTKRVGCGNKTFFCPALNGCFRREMMSPDHLNIYRLHYFVYLVMLSQVKSHSGGVNLEGRLVNLKFTKDCTTNIDSENRCLLFKLRGSFTCEFKTHCYTFIIVYFCV